jgi:hypothetical protein
VYTLANNATSITTSQVGTPTTQTIDPYSLTVLDLAPSG